ncbi:MAG: CrcB family protein [Bdellovibrionota bacterium]
MIRIAMAGAAGVLLRFGIDRCLAVKSGTFPLNTWIINILGSFLAGILFIYFDRGAAPSHWRAPVLVGLLGGFTTFSAYSLQTAAMLESGRINAALLYWSTSPIVGLAAAWAGLKIGRSI